MFSRTRWLERRYFRRALIHGRAWKKLRPDSETTPALHSLSEGYRAAFNVCLRNGLYLDNDRNDTLRKGAQ